jgi:two-component system chemotaxis response regulator CheB
MATRNPSDPLVQGGLITVVSFTRARSHRPPRVGTIEEDPPSFQYSRNVPMNDDPDPQGALVPVVALAASAGGVEALGTVLAGLPPDFPAALVIVQHTAPGGPGLLADVLARRTELRVKRAEEGDLLRPGRAYCAPPDHHLLLRPDGTLELSAGPRVNYTRPAADPTFRSLAACCGPRAVAVVLTGGGADGAGGARAVKAAGGRVVVQSPETAEDPGMPESARETGCADLVLPLGEIAAALVRLVGRAKGGHG